MNKQEINHLVATKVMGWEDFKHLGEIVYKEDLGFGKGYRDLKDCTYLHEWNPLENIEQAMMVMEKMKSLDFDVDISFGDSSGYKQWHCKFLTDADETNILKDNEFEYEDIYLPTAICLAALKAVGVEVGEIDEY